MKQLLIISCICFLRLTCVGQNGENFSYRQVPSSYYKGNVMAANRSASAGFNLVDALPAGYVKDGSVDYTNQVQQALDNNATVIFPDFPIMVNDQGIKVKSNSNLIFPKRGGLVLKPSDKTGYVVLIIHGVNNVNIYNLSIKGDRKGHKGTTGEWGMGVSIRASSDISLINPEISDCWGDGIYIGQQNSIPSKNITISNAVLDYNRRNGISVICVDGLKIDHPVISNTQGTLPMAGIDIEPNNNGDVVNNIDIDAPVTFNNAVYGIVVGLSKLPGEQSKNVNINIRDHVDDGSYTGFYMGGMKPTYNGSALNGKISISNPTWKGNTVAFKRSKTYDFSPMINISNVSIMRPGSNRADAGEADKIRKGYGNDRRVTVN